MPPDVNSTAVNKYMNININISVNIRSDACQETLMILYTPPANMMNQH